MDRTKKIRIVFIVLGLFIAVLGLYLQLFIINIIFFSLFSLQGLVLQSQVSVIKEATNFLECKKENEKSKYPALVKKQF